MRKAPIIRLTSAGLLAVIAVAVVTFAASRDGYRSAYRAWRELDPTLERDAGSAGPEIASRTGKMAAAAEKYGVERGNFLKAIAAESGQGVMGEIAGAAPLPDLASGGAGRVTAQIATLQRNMATYANDPDPGIQRLQAMLQQENAVLKSLSTAISDRQKAFDAARTAAAAAARIRTKALSQERDLIAGMRQASADTDRSTAQWVDYYGSLSAALGGVPAASKSAPQGPDTPVAPASAPAVTPLTLLRYTGEWLFPSNGLFHGIEPESIELLVHEENGHVDGSLSARFKLAPGSKDDPSLRFVFSGEFTSARSQVFNLETSDHAKGTIELIPGSAFNLLEINFETEPKAGKITRANAVLMKK